jgi:hypothetical protein
VRTIGRVRAEVRGPERDLVLEDFQDELERIDDVLVDLTGQRPEPLDAPKGGRTDTPAPVQEDDEEDDEPPAPRVRTGTGTPQLQLTWHDGNVIAWSSGFDAEPEAEPALLERLQGAGASPANWSHHGTISLPDGTVADAVSAPIQSSLGWLVSLVTTGGDDRIGASVTWMGMAAGLAVRLVAHGRMVPQLRKIAELPATVPTSRCVGNRR